MTDNRNSGSDSDSDGAENVEVRELTNMSPPQLDNSLQPTSLPMIRPIPVRPLSPTHTRRRRYYGYKHDRTHGGRRKRRKKRRTKKKSRRKKRKSKKGGKRKGRKTKRKRKKSKKRRR